MAILKQSRLFELSQLETHWKKLLLLQIRKKGKVNSLFLGRYAQNTIDLKTLPIISFSVFFFFFFLTFNFSAAEILVF